MPKKREFSPISDIRPIGQLGRIFGRIISAETGRIFGIGRTLVLAKVLHICGKDSFLQ